MNPAALIKKLKLKPHPEGGYYRETYRGKDRVMRQGDGAIRSVSTAIYFLLKKQDFSALHRIKSDEVWHFYAGTPVLLWLLDPQTRKSRTIKLGPNAEKREIPQAVIPAGCWFAACLQKKNGFALVGCTAAPGFDFRDFEMANRKNLVRKYPGHKNSIVRFTR